MPGGFQDREIVGRHDLVAERPVDERPVGHLESDEVARLDLVDIRKRSQERRPMSGDIDETALARHVRAEISTGAALQGRLIGSVHDHHVQAEAGDDDPTYRLPLPGRVPEVGCRELDCPRLGRGRLASHQRRPGRRLQLVLELLSELVLLPRRIEGGEGVLPLPDDDDPGQSEDAERG